MINGVATIPRLPPAIPMPRRHASQEDYTEELQYQQCALEIKISTLGENHIRVSTAYFAKGSVYSRKEEHDRALECYEEGLRIEKALFGEDHPDPPSHNVQHHRRSVLPQEGVRPGPGVPQEGAPEPAQGPYGSDHPFLVDSYDQMAMAHHSKGDHDRALARYEKALAIKSKSGAEDPPMVGIYNATAWPRCVSRRLLSAVAKGRRSRGSGGGRIRDDAINHKPSAATDGSVTMKRETICAVP